MSIAAAIALLLCVPLVYQSIASGDPYEQHFHASDPTAFAIHAVAVRDSKSLSQYERIKGDALAAYRNKDYATTIKQLKDLKNNFAEFADKDSQLFLILGSSQMVQEDFTKAADNLSKVFNFPDAADNKKEAEWLWALSQYKLGNVDATKEMLQKIQNQKRHAHKTAAKEFLDSIS
jgi:tetratricopeptide (TPR) repeat protein